MCMGMWLFSNQQVFMNKVFLNETTFLFGDTDHKLTQFFTQITPGSVFFVFAFLMMLTHLGRYALRKCNVIDTKLYEEAPVKQKLEPFLNALRPRQVKSYLKEEDVCRNKLGFKRLPDSTYE